MLKHPTVPLAGELQLTAFLSDKVMYIHPNVLRKQPVTQRVAHGQAKTICHSRACPSLLLSQGICNTCALGNKTNSGALLYAPAPAAHQNQTRLLNLEELIRAPLRPPPEPSEGFRVLFLLTCKFTALIQKENSRSQMSRSYVQFPPGVLTFSTWGK